jgi:hypothetical protein
MGAMASSSSFAYWFRGRPIASTAAGSTNHFAHFYRGDASAPVVLVGAAQTVSPSGGAQVGGSAAASKATTVATTSALGLGGGSTAFVQRVVLVGGGLALGGSLKPKVARPATPSGGARFGGSSRATQPSVTSGTFLYWLRGASVSSTASTATGHFDHAYRGSLEFPVIYPSGVRSFSATASGGLRIGGAVRIGRSSSASASGGLRIRGATSVARTTIYTASASLGFGGSSTATAAWSPMGTGGLIVSGAAPTSTAYEATPGGGLSAGGRAEAGLSTPLSTAVGWRFGGRTDVSLLAAAPASGGASFGGHTVMIETGYNIYANDGWGGPIIYAVPIATVYDTSWTSPALAAPGSFKFGVRAFGAASNLEECNLDASVQLDLDALGADVTWVPLPPLGVRALPLAGGRLRVEWNSPAMGSRRRPTGFRVYAQPDDLTDYTTPAAVTPFATDLSGTFAVEIGPLTDGACYAIGVRAYNANGEEQNSNTIRVMIDGQPPSPIDALLATPLPRLS